jgi:hypothetical protein
MFVGYSLDHTADCYEMWNPATSRVHQTRDVIWLNRMYYNRVEPAVNNIIIEPEMEPIIVYHTHNPAIAGSGEVTIVKPRINQRLMRVIPSTMMKIMGSNTYRMNSSMPKQSKWAIPIQRMD